MLIETRSSWARRATWTTRFAKPAPNCGSAPQPWMDNPLPGSAHVRRVSGSAGKTGAAAQVRGGAPSGSARNLAFPRMLGPHPVVLMPPSATWRASATCLARAAIGHAVLPALRPSSAADPADRRRSLAGRLHHAVRFGGAGGQEVTAASADRMPPPARSSVRPHLILWVNGATGYLPGPDSHGFTGRRMKQAMLGGCEAARRLSTSRKGTRPSGRISAPASSSRVT